jgi:signal transduction histidine kinase/GAF domain-containing protein
MLVRERVETWRAQPLAGWIVLVGGILLMSLLIATLDRSDVPLANPGIIYLPLVAMVAYYWGWLFGAVAAVLQLACVYVFFTAPAGLAKTLAPRSVEQLVALAAVTAFMLALVQLAASRRELAELEAGRFAALSSVGIALASERDEARLLHLIAQTARNLTGAEFAAFTLRPLDAMGQPLVPAEGNLFYLAAVVGVTKGQEELFRRMPLGGEGLLAPIFRQGVPVRVTDALDLRQPAHGAQTPALASAASAASETRRDAARRSAVTYAHGARSERSEEHLVALGVPRGHPVVRSFLGAPLLDSRGQVRGGLLLGHSAPGRFSRDHEELLLGLTAEASVAVENVRLYHSASAQAEELDTIFESIADGVLVVDDKGTVLRENETAATLRAEITRGAHPEDTLSALLREPAQRALAAEGGTSEPITLVLDGAEVRDIIASASPLRLSSAGSARSEQVAMHLGDGESRAVDAAHMVVIVWHDVTEARRLVTERQARSQAEARWKLLQHIIDELPSGAYLVRGTDARLILANRAAVEVWGARWPEGMPMSEFLQTFGTRIFGTDGKLLTSDDLATFRAIRTCEPIRHHQENIRRPDGVTLPILLNAVSLDPSLFNEAMPADPAHSDTPEPVALVVLQDMTALKEAERLKDEFIAIAAHELRNPTTAIKGYADMLRMRTERSTGHPLQDWQVEAITTIDQSTSRLVELTEDLLDVTRLQAGRLELRLEAHDLVALARRVAKRLQVTTSQHTLTVHADSEYAVVLIDVKRVEQVLTNIITNAIKYSPDGGSIDITIGDDPATDSATLSVRDEGIGIPQAQQGRIFGRFERAENARTLGIGGTGLGLYLSRELVVRHGGRIWFESTEGRGTTFYITLPLIADDGSRVEPDGAGTSQVADVARQPVHDASAAKRGS